MYAIQTGIDTTEPFDSGSGRITIPAGGIVEINGFLFKITAEITLQKPNANLAYWVAVQDNGNGSATAQLVERPGKWNSAKQGCYRTDGRRTLNWVSQGSTVPQGVTEHSSPALKGSYRNSLKKGWKFVRLISGAGGGLGGRGGDATSSAAGQGGSGGIISNSDPVEDIFFHKGGNVKIFIGGSGRNGCNGGNGRSDGNNGRGGGGGYRDQTCGNTWH